MPSDDAAPSSDLTPTVGRFLDRRMGLPSYDPFNDDDEGSNLMTVLAPALRLGSAISLEYLFSTTNGGAGSRVPANVVGNFGMQQGSTGDLLGGLPTQLSEMHSPQRALALRPLLAAAAPLVGHGLLLLLQRRQLLLGGP